MTPGNASTVSRSTVATSTTANLYIATVAAAGATVLMVSLRDAASAAHGGAILAWAAMALLTLASGGLSMKLPLRDYRVSFSDAFIFLTLLQFGPELATLTAALDGFAASSRRKGTWRKRVFNTAAMAITVNLSARVYAALLPAGSGGARTTLAGMFVPLAGLFVAQYFINTLLVSVVVYLSERTSLSAIWQDSFSWAGTAYLAGLAAAVSAFTLLPAVAGPASFAAIAPVPLLLYFTYRFCRQHLCAKRAPIRG